MQHVGMVRYVAIVAIVGACSFEPGVLRDGSVVSPDGDADAELDAQSDPCGTPMVWRASFDADPTLADSNGDGTNDWMMRDTGTLAGSLANGIWSEPGTPIRPLDTQPRQDFATRTIVDVRMRNTVRGSSWGAVFWINVDYGLTTFAPLYVVVQLQTGGTAQDVTLFGKTTNPTPVALVSTSVATTDFIHIQLDIDPSTDAVTMTLGTVSTTRTYPTFAHNGNGDRWATVLAWDGDAEFDDVRVAVCP